MSRLDYNGPGEYTVRVCFSGSTTVTVTASCVEDAYRKAEDEADDFDCCFEAEADEIVSVSPMAGDPMPFDWLEKLTSVEEAVWINTGKVPPEALKRLSEVAAEELEARYA